MFKGIHFEGKAVGKKSRHWGFWALIATQAQGAFSDNVLKMLVVLSLPSMVNDPEYPVTAVAFMLMSLPPLLIPSLAGSLADRFSKQRVAVMTKILEIAVMAMGLTAFLLQSPTLIWLTVFMMATQSAFFNPAKYGILPEILPESKLSWGNGILQMATFVSIIAGLSIVGPLVEIFDTRIYLVSVVLVVLAGAGLVSSLFITKPPPASPTQAISLNPWSGMGRYFNAFYADRWLFLTMLGIGYFWFAAVLTNMNIIELSKEQDMSPVDLSRLLASIALGIGLGSAAAGFLSRNKIEVGLIPLGGLGLGSLSLALGLPEFIGREAWSYTEYLAILFALGFFAGVFNLPLAATLQHRSPEHIKGGMIATSNFVNNSAMLLSSLSFYLLFTVSGLSTSAIFLIYAGLTIAVSAYICAVLPFFLLRFLLWILANTFYRIKVLGRENIPEKGGALFVANHTSFMDALLLLASTDRRVRFVMYRANFDTFWIRPIAKIMGVIPIAAGQSSRELSDSLAVATEAINEGDVVCIFAEGQITRTGQMLPFQQDFKRIMKDTDAPIIPVHLGRLWGSIFSFANGRFFWKAPKKLPYPITVSYGTPMPSASTPHALRHAIQELDTDSFVHRRFPMLHRSFVRTARRHAFGTAMADARSPKVSYIKALIGSIVLGRKLKAVLSEKAMVGLLLPPSVGAAFANIALHLMGKVPVNLNYTASAEALRSAAEQCDITHVLTSEEFLKKVKVEVPGQPIYLDEVLGSVSFADRLVGAVWACAFPVRLIERLLGAESGRSEEDLATVIFSSGSEGDPKGVMLSHRNIASQAEAIMQVFPHSTKDGVMGMLPFFHSFGFTATIWLPLLNGLKAVYHPNPLDARAIGALIHEHELTFFIATSTLLQGFIRRCEPGHLSTLKYVICGAEKLSPQISEAFRQKFGVEPIEAYGATECAPGITMNIPNFRMRGFFQRGTKPGTVGHPLPGLTVVTADLDTGELLPEGQEGMLLVKGPNIMKGYLGQPEKTAAVLTDGWYRTGDIGTIDEEGFVSIQGRLTRFSKIAGEMVPHGKVEETLHKVMDFKEQVLVVLGLPDEKKGERLVVLHTLSETQLDELKGNMKQSGLPNLWLPSPDAFYKIDEIPVLGSGKTDLRRLNAMAKAMSTAT